MVTIYAMIVCSLNFNFGSKRLLRVLKMKYWLERDALGFMRQNCMIYNEDYYFTASINHF